MFKVSVKVIEQHWVVEETFKLESSYVLTLLV